MHDGNFHSDYPCANWLRYPNGVVVELRGAVGDASVTSANSWNKQQEEQTEFPAGSCLTVICAAGRLWWVKRCAHIKVVFLTQKNIQLFEHTLCSG